MDSRTPYAPRLDRLGADVSKVAVPHPSQGFVTSLLNASFIEQAVKQVGPKLLIIDPIVAFAGKKNTQRSDEVRELLSPLVSLAERHAFACLLIRHFTKGEASKAMYRGSGAIDFAAVCRSQFLIVESDEEPDTRILAQVKNSMGPKVPSLAFTINGQGFHWGKEINVDADDLLTARSTDRKGKGKSQVEIAIEFLERYLADGPRHSNSVKADGKQAGIAWGTMWRAKEALRLKPFRQHGDAEWSWSLERRYATNECHDQHD